MTAWPYNGHWANWYNGYEHQHAPHHPWAGHGWAADGHIGHLQLAHFVPNQGENEGYWWFEEDDWGLSEDVQGLPTGDPEDPWYPTDWTEEMQADVEELVGMLAGLDPEEDDEAAAPGQSGGPLEFFPDASWDPSQHHQTTEEAEEEVFEGLLERLQDDLVDKDSIW